MLTKPLLPTTSRVRRPRPFAVGLTTGIAVALAVLAAAPVASAQSASPALPVKQTTTGVDFSATPNPQLPRQNIKFDGSGSHVTCGGWFWGCTADTYTWDFGDGTTGSGAVVNHSYARPGTYTVTLEACDCIGGGGFSSTARHSVTILPPDKTRSVTLSTSMSGAEQSETTPGDPDGTGHATFTLYPDAAEICFTISFANIENTAGWAAHIHKAPRGRTQFVPSFDFSHIPAPRSPVSGCRPADPLSIGDIIARPTDFYAQLHNVEYPEGVIRGQLGD